jgi:hypothetical protein
MLRMNSGQPATENLSRGSPAIHREPNFQTLLQVPATHRLLPVRSRVRGGIFKAVYWDHEEYDTAGQLVARYECFDESAPNGEHLFGWRKYDEGGCLVQEGQWTE